MGYTQAEYESCIRTMSAKIERLEVDVHQLLLEKTTLEAESKKRDEVIIYLCSTDHSEGCMECPLSLAHLPCPVDNILKTQPGRICEHCTKSHTAACNDNCPYTFKGPGSATSYRTPDKLMERLASIEHDQWAHVVKSCGHPHPLVDVPYNELTEEQKNKDREWATKVISEIEKYDDEEWEELLRCIKEPSPAPDDKSRLLDTEPGTGVSSGLLADRPGAPAPTQAKPDKPETDPRKEHSRSWEYDPDKMCIDCSKVASLKERLIKERARYLQAAYPAFGQATARYRAKEEIEDELREPSRTKPNVVVEFGGQTETQPPAKMGVRFAGPSFDTSMIPPGAKILSAKVVGIQEIRAPDEHEHHATALEQEEGVLIEHCPCGATREFIYGCITGSRLNPWEGVPEKNVARKPCFGSRHMDFEDCTDTCEDAKECLAIRSKMMEEKK